MSEKLDGVRCQWTGTKLFTRDGTELGVPEFFKREFPKSPLDGELFISRNRYNELISILSNKKRSEKDWVYLTFVVLDAPTLNAVFNQRLEALKRVISNCQSQFIRLHDFKYCNGRDSAYEYLKNIAQKGNLVKLNLIMRIVSD